MTEKQAIKIRSIFCNRIPQEELYTQMTNELAIEIANAIKKQIPKNPITSLNSAKCWCPNCLILISKSKYCSECGQALDWSDTE